MHKMSLLLVVFEMMRIIQNLGHVQPLYDK